MTSPPPEPYFADGLLERWERGIPESTVSEVQNANQVRARIRKWPSLSPADDPVTVCIRLDGLHEGARLRSLILAELAGARRAREKAEEWASITLHPDHQHYHKTLLAREILEAFDAK